VLHDQSTIDYLVKTQQELASESNPCAKHHYLRYLSDVAIEHHSNRRVRIQIIIEKHNNMKCITNIHILLEFVTLHTNMHHIILLKNHMFIIIRHGSTIHKYSFINTKRCKKFIFHNISISCTYYHPSSFINHHQICIQLSHDSIMYTSHHFITYITNMHTYHINNTSTIHIKWIT
jgi:hypothetical protein